MNKPGESLEELVRQAARETANRAERMDTRNAKASWATGWKFLLLIAFVAGATLWAIFQLTSLLLPPTQGQMRSDLLAVAEQARRSVEAARARDGKLPPALPNAAMASIVNYEIKDTGYRLVVLTVSSRIEIDEAGKQIINDRKNTK